MDLDLAYCERCGHWYLEGAEKVGDYMLGKVVAIDDETDNVTLSTAGFCPSCRKAFKEWLHQGKIEKHKEEK